MQDALEAALAQFANQPIRIACAGRTDAGVHALGQVVHFETDATRTLQGWVRGVNALLPDSIGVTWAAIVDDTFDARFCARARTYYYLLLIQPYRSPHWVGRAGWTHTPLDVEAMRMAARSLVGTHDFSAFRSAECQAKSPIKSMTNVDVEQSENFIRFTFKANAFVHHMVRNLVGASIAIGRGTRDPSWIAQLLENRDRTLAAPTFMPDGLYLAKVDYPTQILLPEPQPFTMIHSGFAS